MWWKGPALYTMKVMMKRLSPQQGARMELYEKKGFPPLYIIKQTSDTSSTLGPQHR